MPVGSARHAVNFGEYAGIGAICGNHILQRSPGWSQCPPGAAVSSSAPQRPNQERLHPRKPCLSEASDWQGGVANVGPPLAGQAQHEFHQPFPHTRELMRMKVAVQVIRASSALTQEQFILGCDLLPAVCRVPRPVSAAPNSDPKEGMRRPCFTESGAAEREGLHG